MNFLLGQIPLHRDRDKAQIENDGNLGLWFARVGVPWKEVSRRPSGKELLTHFRPSRHAGQAPELAAFQDRRNRLVDSQKGVSGLFKTKGPFFTGAGIPGFADFGFAWHHVLGVPYLPGSAAKGMALAYAQQWCDEEPHPEDLTGIFGEQDDNCPEQTGRMIFLDAVPVEPCLLKLDILTPHHKAYHESREWPADWESPLPVTFLTVASGQSFQFALLPAVRCPSPLSDRDQHLRDLAWRWLTGALALIGAGAKTMKGYGRFADATPSATPSAASKSHRR